MVTIQDILDMDLLHEMLAGKFIRAQNHPRQPYQILNYTEKAQFDRVWNDVTRTCRGLIFNVDTGEVVARPFRKFFNWGEEDSLSFETYRNSPVSVTDKLDGSLGILYPNHDGYGLYTHAVATRGSFTSPQARHATEILEGYLEEDWYPPDDYTLLWEIIYPENRIVCNYYAMDDLVLLGAVHNRFGYSVGPSSEELADWPGPRAMVFNHKTFQSALDAKPRQGAEGLVVHFLDSDKRVKLKQADYIQLHRVVTGLNERRVWECMKDGKFLHDIQAPLPEEFHTWVETVYNTIQDQWYTYWYKVHKVFDKIVDELPADFSRKDFALKAIGNMYSPALFNLLDKKDISEHIWEQLKPDFRQGPWSRGEDEQ
jgi:RNA ligase